MNRNQTKRSFHNQQVKASRVLVIVFAAVLFVGLFVQIAMVARMMDQNKQVRAVETEIRELSARADNLNLALSQYSNLELVASQAAKLGMTTPTEGQIRVVNLPDAVEYTSAQSADGGVEEMKQ